MAREHSASRKTHDAGRMILRAVRGALPEDRGSSQAFGRSTGKARQLLFHCRAAIHRAKTLQSRPIVLGSRVVTSCCGLHVMLRGSSDVSSIERA